jgi:chorismate-pyruvate lyase
MRIAFTRRPEDLDTPPLAKAVTRIGSSGCLLLISDGTLTPMLEQLTGEGLATSGLAQSALLVDPAQAIELGFARDQTLVRRTTDLVGVESGTAYVRAKTVMAVDSLPPVLRADLLQTREPIGRLMRRHRVESRREMLLLNVPDEPVGSIAASRRYRIFVGGRPALLIDECFFASCFV